MKKYVKIVIFCLMSLIAMSALTSFTMGTPTTIEDSTYPASDGEYYQWTCTYCNDSFDDYIGEGSYYNVTIGTIYQGSYMAINHALIVPAIKGSYFKGFNMHSLDIASYYCVYNASLHYVYLDLLFIVPIPLNLTMIAEFIIMDTGNSAVVSGNSIIIDNGAVFIETYNYNSNGFCTSYTVDYEGKRLFTFKLEGGEEEIIFGNYFFIPTVITIGIIVIFIKRRYAINKQTK
ncbi:MAG: hypothetical protein ACFE9T_10635 [Promethearchaeota archaeon]